MNYPKEVFSINETITKENMRQYDAWRERVYKRCKEIAPDYWSLDFRTRLEIKERAEKEVQR